MSENIPQIEALDYELPMIRDMDSGFYLRQEAHGLLFGPWEEDCRAAWTNQSAPWDFGMELFEDDLDRMEDGDPTEGPDTSDDSADEAPVEGEDQ